MKEKLPGLSFRVLMTEETSSTLGRRIGRISLECSIEDKEMWEKAVKQLDGFKVFGATKDEMIDALNGELDKTAAEQTELQAIIERKDEELRQKDEEIRRLRSALASIGHDLGIE